MATSTSAARRLLIPAIACAMTFTAVSAPSLADEIGQQSATTCAAERCLAVGWSADVTEALASDRTLDIDALSRGLSVDYRGNGELAVRLIAARYDRGRLVRYGVSERAMLEGPGAALAIPGADAVLAKAFGPAINRDVAVAAIEHDLLQPQMQTPSESFVGEVPPTYLAAAEGRALFPMEDVPAEDVHTLFDGSVGVVAILPDDDDLRAPEALATQGAVVSLLYTPKDRASPTG